MLHAWTLQPSQGPRAGPRPGLRATALARTTVGLKTKKALHVKEHKRKWKDRVLFY